MAIATTAIVAEIGVRRRGGSTDPEAQRLLNQIHRFLGSTVESIEVVRLYAVECESEEIALLDTASRLLCDPVLEDSFLSKEDLTRGSYDWTVTVWYKEGVTDTLGTIAKEALLTECLVESVCSGREYRIRGTLDEKFARRIAHELLANPLIEDIAIAPVTHDKVLCQGVSLVDLEGADTALMEISRTRLLALSLEEMHAIAAYYKLPKTRALREEYGMPPVPTDVELEALAQTWSEHCKHKIFNARIRYREGGSEEIVDSIFKSCIAKATEVLASDWLVSVFSDNAGIVRFSETHNIAFKVETHNSPSALDPYGGALTGILGVNRDILGAGIGARCFANTDVFCFAQPNYEGGLPPRLQHPRRVMEGVRRGVEHGGNKSGIPTVNGAVVFDKSYLGKPLVYCGTAGILPRQINGVRSEDKVIKCGDLAVVAGGRTGRDGIHGATFSSEALHAESPTSAVQIGDPFTQKKLSDFLLDARDCSLYRCVTDNGAGGLSSSIGELAELSGGCEIRLDLVPRKATGLYPWEVLVSESQERMTFAVDPNTFSGLSRIAKKHDVEIAVVGKFTDSGLFHVIDEEQTVALLDMQFFHDGTPQMDLIAEWNPPIESLLKVDGSEDCGDLLHGILGSYNVCSRELIIRQYDHEVQAGTVVKPLVGVDESGPGDAAVVVPLEEREQGNGPWKGVVISNGICPQFSEYDAYHMAANAVDEAVRNAVAVGADPKKIAILDNFCWPDPVYHRDTNPDGKHKLAQLVRANRALYDIAVALETPIISGKDSMKNDYHIGDVKISILPTLLVSAMGQIKDASQAVTMDVKNVGDSVYVVGVTKKELGGSQYAALKNTSEGSVPKVDADTAHYQYRAVHRAITAGLVASCHDCSDGGVAVALAESAFSGKLGMEIDLSLLAVQGKLNGTERLFSESASRFVITVPIEHVASFEKMMAGAMYSCIGKVIEQGTLTIREGSDEVLLCESIDALQRSWKRTLGGEG